MACVAWGRRVKWWPVARWLAEWCRAEGIDHLHAAWSGVPAEVAWLARRLGGPRFSVSAHANDVYCPPIGSAAALLAAEGVTVCNRAAGRELLARLPALRPRLVYQPHGLPLDEWPVREREPSGPPVVLAIGRLVPKKGFDLLLEAAARLPGVAVRLIGDGPERAALAALAAARRVELALPGRVGQDQVRAELAAATVLAMPSRVDRAGDRDGLANVLLEALATGVPVVTTTAGSAEDAVVHGRTGLLVPPGDPAALAAGLGRLLGDPVLCGRLAGAGRKMVEARFDIRVLAARRARWLSAMSAQREP